MNAVPHLHFHLFSDRVDTGRAAEIRTSVPSEGLKHRRTWVVPAISFLAALAVFSFLTWRRTPDPIYEGKKISAYLTRAYPPNGSTPSASSIDDARAALRAVAPDAAPLLAVWLRETDSPVKSILRRMFAACKYPCPNWCYDRSGLAMWALRAEPRNGALSVTVLANWIETGPSPKQYSGAVVLHDVLAGLPSATQSTAAERCVRALPVLLDRAAHSTEGEVYLNTAVEIIRRAPSFVETALPARARSASSQEPAEQRSASATAAMREQLLDQLLSQESTPLSVMLLWLRRDAVKLLDPDGSLRKRVLHEPVFTTRQAEAAFLTDPNEGMLDDCLPVLISRLSSTNSNTLIWTIDLLSSYGRDAGSVAGKLEALRSHPDTNVVTAADRCLSLIAP